MKSKEWNEEQENIDMFDSKDFEEWAALEDGRKIEGL